MEAHCALCFACLPFLCMMWMAGGGRGKKEGSAPGHPEQFRRILQASFFNPRTSLPTKPNRNSYVCNVVRKNTRRCSGSGSRHCGGPCLCIRSCQRQRSANHVARRHGPETGCGDGTSQKSSQVREHHPGMCVYRPMCIYIEYAFQGLVFLMSLQLQPLSFLCFVLSRASWLRRA